MPIDIQKLIQFLTTAGPLVKALVQAFMDLYLAKEGVARKALGDCPCDIKDHLLEHLDDDQEKLLALLVSNLHMKEDLDCCNENTVSNT